MRKLGGTAITEFIESGKLRSADILLEHSRSGLWGWIIRLGTGTYWNHAMMVCAAKDTRENSETMVIDPRMGGIRVVNAARCFETLQDCDIAVKRLDKDWFQNDNNGGFRFRKMVSDFAIRRVDDRPETTVSLGRIRRLLRKLSLISRFVFQKRKLPKRRRPARSSKPLNLNAYSCSGVVQWSYFWGIARVETEDRHPESRLREVTFSSRLTEDASDSELLTITPADLARSDKLSWKYVVKDGVVWEVSGEKDVNTIIETQNRK